MWPRKLYRVDTELLYISEHLLQFINRNTLAIFGQPLRVLLYLYHTFTVKRIKYNSTFVYRVIALSSGEKQRRYRQRRDMDPEKRQ